MICEFCKEKIKVGDPFVIVNGHWFHEECSRFAWYVVVWRIKDKGGMRNEKDKAHEP